MSMHAQVHILTSWQLDLVPPQVDYAYLQQVPYLASASGIQARFPGSIPFAKFLARLNCMHTVHLQFASAEDAKWVREICQKQLENPGERVDKLHMGILIDSIRKARSVSQTVPDIKGLPHI